MDIECAIKKYQLSEEDFERHADNLFKILAMNAKPTNKPKLVLVGGQAGSGKTGLVAKKNKELAEGAIIIDQDEIRARFPEEMYREILQKYDDREEYLILKPYVLKMRQALVDRARNGGYNVIMETAMQAVDSFIPQIQSFEDAGYDTELSVIAVPETDCFLSTLNRYCLYLQKDGYCRRNTKMDSQMIVKLRNNLEKFDQTKLFDNINIYVRGENPNQEPIQIYSDKSGTMETPLQAFDKGIRKSRKQSRNTFPRRAKAIRKILEEFNENEQINTLNQIEQQFEKEMEDRGEYDE